MCLCVCIYSFSFTFRSVIYFDNLKSFVTLASWKSLFSPHHFVFNKIFPSGDKPDFFHPGSAQNQQMPLWIVADLLLPSEGFPFLEIFLQVLLLSPLSDALKYMTDVIYLDFLVICSVFLACCELLYPVRSGSPFLTALNIFKKFVSNF